MNDRNDLDIGTSNGNIDVSMEFKTDVSGVSATNRLTVADTHLVYKIIFCVMGVIFLIALCFGDLKANATENSVYVDSAYMQEQFGSYKYYAIVTDGSGNYATLFTNGRMIANGGLVYSLMSYDDFGFKTMKLEDNYLVIDDSGSSYSGRSSVTVQLNAISYGIPSNMNTFLYANQDVYGVKFSNTGSPSVSDSVFFSISNNIGSKPIEEPTEPTPGVTVECKFTDENIVEKLETMNGSLETMNGSIELLTLSVTQKLDLILTLLLIFMALKMFSPLANNYKRGLQKKEKQ